MFAASFVRIALAAATADVEVSFSELSSALDLDTHLGTLEKLEILRGTLAALDLSVRPGFDKGEMETVRLLGKANRQSMTNISQELSGESALCEYKASLCFDHRRFDHNPHTPKRDCYNDALVFAGLKTIAAFLNSSGGKLFIGVRDDGSICGISQDYSFCKAPNVDSWELMLRDLVKGNFYDGDTVNNYLRVEFAPVGGDHFCRIEVTPRTKLSFLCIKKERRYGLFIRQGNRTVELGIQEVEDFLATRTVRTRPSA